MNELEIEVMQAMVKLIVRFPDGIERIETCLGLLVEAGLDMEEPLMKSKKDWVH